MPDESARDARALACALVDARRKLDARRFDELLDVVDVTDDAQRLVIEALAEMAFRREEVRNVD